MNEDKYWHGLEPIQIGPYRIESPLTYVRDKISPFSDPSCITCDLEVDLNGIPSEPLGYYPSYAGLTPTQRNYYLQWMSGGREVFPNEQGYAFIFYYGLERRALEENSDIGIIISEVIRLRKLHTQTTLKRSSFLAYSEELLWFLLAEAPLDWEEATVQELARDNVNGKGLEAAIHWAGIHYRFLPDWLAFSVGFAYYPHKDDYFNVRKKQTFSAFQKRYFRRWPQGINLRPTPSGAKIDYETEYYAASSKLSAFSTKLPFSKKVINELSFLEPICSECLHEQPHPLRDTISQIIGNVTPENKYFTVKVSHVADAINLPIRDKYTPTQSNQIADLLDECGYSIEPDSRITKRGYGSNEIGVVFGNCEETSDTDRFEAACYMLRLGLVISSAGDRSGREQFRMLAKHILDLFSLTDAEQQRVAALANLWIATSVRSQKMPLTFKKLLTQTQRQMTGKFLIAFAGSDGVINRDELKVLQSTFKRLELEPKLLNKYIDELRAQESVIVIRQGKKPSRGEKIPPPVKESVVVQLDTDLIKELLRDTREAQQILAKAMDVEANEEKLPIANENGYEESHFEEVQIQNAPTKASETIQTTPSEHLTRFYERLIEKDDWPILEISSLAKEYGHMYNGAIEEINDWATEYLGGALLYEDGDRLIVERELLHS